MFYKTTSMTVWWLSFVILISVIGTHSFGILGYEASANNQDHLISTSSFMATCTVTTAEDSGLGSLRQCLLDAAPSAAIDFDPQTFPASTPTTVTLSVPLPTIITDSLTIDGSNAGVILDGSQLSEGAGLVIDGSDGVVIRGLQIINFPEDGITVGGGARHTVIGGDRSIGAGVLGQGNLISHNGHFGVSIKGQGTKDNQVRGNYIGTDVAGTSVFSNLWDGLAITEGAQENVVGGNSDDTRNIVSGNRQHGIVISDQGTNSNQVFGNYVGIDVSGTIKLANGWDGVVIENGAQLNLVGGTGSARNVISGNTYQGLVIQNEGTTGNQARGNYIGTDPTGTHAIKNEHQGIVIRRGAANNVVGGETAKDRNLVSGNGRFGIYIENEGTNGNRVIGNYIGTDVAGTSALGNSWAGVAIMNHAQDNVVGGDSEGERNIISGNKREGVAMSSEGTTGNHVIGNYIGLDVTGTSALGNLWSGVAIRNHAQNNVVGGDSEGERNIISANKQDGVGISGESPTGNYVIGNYIGTDVTGTSPLGNHWSGVAIRNHAKDNFVGGESEGKRNIISANKQDGVGISGESPTGNYVIGNYIGTDVTGTSPLGNLWAGVVIRNHAQDNVVGGESEGKRNIISANQQDGVAISGAGTTGNHVIGNYIGVDVTGTKALGNGWNSGRTWNGLSISDGAKDNIIGGDTESARNIISGNAYGGALIYGKDTGNNQVRGNYIGTNVFGTESLGNHVVGVGIGEEASDNTIVSNLISGNSQAGVALTETSNNKIQANYIGTDLSGQLVISNRSAGIAVQDAQNNMIGGETAGLRNLISGNSKGVIFAKGADNNQLLGNYIGTDVTGTQALTMQEIGVEVSNRVLGARRLKAFEVSNGAKNNVIGGSQEGARNIISGHSDVGVLISGSSVTGNQVSGNYIGTNVTGNESQGNIGGGIRIRGGASDNVIGGEMVGSGNRISGNGKDGVQLQGSGTSNNRIQGNEIGINAQGSSLPNVGAGIYLVDGASSNMIGISNTIAYNGSSGVILEGAETISNTVTHNMIHDNVAHGVHLINSASTNVIGPGNSITYNAESGITIDGQASSGNTITRNIIHHNNEKPIEFINVSIPPLSPQLQNYLPSENVLVGTTCSSCRVEVFANPGGESAGTLFLNEITAEKTGEFTITVNMPNDLPYLSATQTDLNGSTSKFSDSWGPVFPTSPVTPTPTPIDTSTNLLYLPILLR